MSPSYLALLALFQHACIPSSVIGKSNELRVRDSWLLYHTATNKPCVSLVMSLYLLSWWMRVWKFPFKSRSLPLLFSLKPTFLFIRGYLYAFSYLFIFLLPWTQSKHYNESSSNSTIPLYGDFILHVGHTKYFPSYWIFGNKRGSVRYQLFVEFLVGGRGIIANLGLLWTI